MSQRRKAATNLQQVIDFHTNALNTVSNYAYFELAYTRHTGWMVWVTSHQRTEHPNRQVLMSGQGSTPDEACKNALSEPAIEFNADQIVESLIDAKQAEIDRLTADNERLLAAQAWRPISTAPKDGSWIIVGCKEISRSAKWSDSRGKWMVSPDWNLENPTRWMPLPEGDQS